MYKVRGNTSAFYRFRDKRMGDNESSLADDIVHMRFVAVNCDAEAALLRKMDDLRFHIVLFVC